MDLIKKLEARAKELDRRVQQALVSGSYDQQAADDRELLTKAAKSLETFVWMTRRFVENACADDR